MTLKYRDAAKEDCAKLAEFINIASDGVVEFLFQELVSGMTPVQLNHFYSSRIENSWFLDALCVVESHRSRGIGKKLISITKEKAVENGFKIY